VIEHYMLQSEQLDTRLVLAANGEVAAGLLIQRLPMQGTANLSGAGAIASDEDQIGQNEDYNRIAILAASLKREELLTLDADTILRRLFWEEMCAVSSLRAGEGPRFACTCSRERVSGMLRGLGRDEIESIIAEQGQVEVGCDFCGAQYRFDPVDAATVFFRPQRSPPVHQACTEPVRRGVPEPRDAVEPASPGHRRRPPAGGKRRQPRRGESNRS
jgi:molecular chaperone Hsp33